MNLIELAALLKENVDKLNAWKEENIGKLDKKLSNMVSEAKSTFGDDQEMLDLKLSEINEYITKKKDQLAKKLKDKIQKATESIDTKIDKFKKDKEAKLQEMIESSAKIMADNEATAKQNKL